MRAATRVLLAICACAAVLPAGVAHAQDEQPVVVAGLRPTSDGDYKSTDIKKLAQAQKLRDFIDEGTKAVSGRAIINHAALKVELGSAYLVDLFACEGQVKCVVKVFAKLKPKAKLLVYGDYGPRRKNAVVRLRLIELASGKLLAEEEFVASASELQDDTRWKKALTALFDAVGISAGQPPEGGGKTPPEGGGKTPPEGGGKTPPEGGGKTPPEGGGKTPPEGGGETPPEGGGETAAGGGEGGSNASADELTDADFGEVTTQVEVAPQARREDVTWIDAASTFALVKRRFVFKVSEDNEILRPDGLESDWTAKVGVSGHVYPFAWRKKGGLLEQLGVVAEYARTDISAEGGRETQLYVGGLFRIPVGKTATHPTFNISSGFVRHDFVMLEDATVAVPSVSYRGVTVGGDARAPIGTPRIALLASAEYLFGFVSKGELFADDSYGPSTVGGIDASAALEVRPLSFLFIRVGGRFTRIFIEFDGDGSLSSDGAVTGAQDRFVAAQVSAGIVK